MNAFGAVCDGLPDRLRIAHRDTHGAERLVAILPRGKPQSEVGTCQLGGGIP